MNMILCMIAILFVVAMVRGIVGVKERCLGRSGCYVVARREARWESNHLKVFGYDEIVSNGDRLRWFYLVLFHIEGGEKFRSTCRVVGCKWVFVVKSLPYVDPSYVDSVLMVMFENDDVASICWLKGSGRKRLAADVALARKSERIKRYSANRSREEKEKRAISDRKRRAENRDKYGKTVRKRLSRRNQETAQIAEGFGELPEHVENTVPLSANERAKKCFEEMLELRVVCMVCNCKTDAKKSKVESFDDMKEKDKEKLRDATLLPEIRFDRMSADLTSGTVDESGRITTTTSTGRAVWCQSVHPNVKQFYNINEVIGDEYFNNCLLSRHGVIMKDGKVSIVRCHSCISQIHNSKNRFVPPKFAITNNLFIGALPKDLPEMNETDKLCLRLFTPYLQFNILQKGRKNAKLYSSVSLFQSGNSVAGELMERLPRVMDSTTTPFHVLFQTDTGAEENDEAYVKRKYYADPLTIKKWFEWLTVNNHWYRERSWDEESMRLIVEAQLKDGGVVKFVARTAGSNEVSTPIGPTSEEVGDRDKSSTDQDEIEEIAEAGTVHLRKAKGHDEEDDIQADAMNFEQVHNVELKSIKLDSGSLRAFPNQEGVLEGSLFWLFPYGSGGLKVARQTPLTSLEYFDGLTRLADGDFGKNRTVHALAAECIRYEAGSKQVFKLSGQGVNGLLSASVDELGAAIEEREKNRKNQWKCPPIAGGCYLRCAI